MRKSVTVAVAAMFGSSVMAFAPSTLLRPTVSPSTTAVGLKMAYIPDGLSPKEWKKIQAEEKKKKQDLGRMGPSRFKSRSFQAWQDAGAGHLFPVDPKKVREAGSAARRFWATSFLYVYVTDYRHSTYSRVFLSSVYETFEEGNLHELVRH